MRKTKHKAVIKDITETHSLPVLWIKGRPDGRGVECCFYKKAGKGYKFYETYDEAIRAKSRQDLAHKQNIGPKTGRLIMALGIRYNKTYARFGYETEIAKRASYCFYEKHRDGLVKKLKKTRIPSYDVEQWNCGRIGNRLVLVDFGQASCGNWW